MIDEEFIAMEKKCSRMHPRIASKMYSSIHNRELRESVNYLGMIMPGLGLFTKMHLFRDLALLLWDRLESEYTQQELFYYVCIWHQELINIAAH